MKPRELGIAFAAVVALASASFGQETAGYPEFAFGMGYAHIDVGGSSSQLHSMDALRIEPALVFSPIEQLPQLRLGADFGVSMVLDNSSRTIIVSGGSLIITGSSDIPFLVLEPEARISWKQSFGDTFFIEPGFALGGAFGQLHIHSETQSINQWSSCFMGRAFLNVGFDLPIGSAGIQASYMRGGNMDFGANAHGDLGEFYIGLFGSIRF